jgi:hypothetical protein
VRQQAPSRGVPLRGKEVAPILSDEPRAEEGRELGSARQFPQLRNPADEKECKHAESKHELVNAKATEIDAETKPVTFDAKHGTSLDSVG